MIGGEIQLSTLFSTVYDRFLGKITDDMYLELTPQDTYRDLQNLLLEAIPGFEFPRCNLYDYTLNIEQRPLNDLDLSTMVVQSDSLDEQQELVWVDTSSFNADLTSEEINILALLMKQAWVQRQVTSIENTRMKYSSSDFKMTSQANHLSKLLTLLTECRRDSFHMQRLYKRRKLTNNGEYKSNWSSFREKSAIN